MHIDIWSKGEVVSFLEGLLKKGQIQPCLNLKLKKGHMDAYYPECVGDWASWVRASNVTTSITAYHGPSSYWWPSCPENCRGFQKTEDFMTSLLNQVESKPHKPSVQSENVYPDTNRIRSKDIFIIHGHDEVNKLKLQNLLKDRFQLNPIVLSEKPGAGRTLIEKFEKEAETSGFTFALITPDDIVKTESGKYAQARPNVVFELGWFCGRLGRKRTCILFKKGTQIHSDLEGVSRIEYIDSVEEKILNIEKELKAAKLI
jgi:predicted nucleotide-binding protein